MFKQGGMGDAWGLQAQPRSNVLSLLQGRLGNRSLASSQGKWDSQWKVSPNRKDMQILKRTRLVATTGMAGTYRSELEQVGGLGWPLPLAAGQRVGLQIS